MVCFPNMHQHLTLDLKFGVILAKQNVTTSGFLITLQLNLCLWVSHGEYRIFFLTQYELSTEKYLSLHSLWDTNIKLKHTHRAGAVV